MGVAGRVALVTGGGSGIGRATSHRLAAEGMRVCVVDRDATAAAAVADATGGLALVADVSVAEQVDAAFAGCAERLGTVDLVSANAGVVSGHDDPATLDVDLYRRVVGVNVDGVVFTLRAAVWSMRASGHGGVIVATASLAGLVPLAPDPVYALTKHAVVGYVRSIATAVAADGIAVHAVCPGFVDTALMTEASKDALRGAGFALMAPEQIADAIVHAAAATPDTSGTCWVCQPGIDPTPYRFPGVPGPRAEAADDPGATRAPSSGRQPIGRLPILEPPTQEAR